MQLRSSLFGVCVCVRCFLQVGISQELQQHTEPLRPCGHTRGIDASFWVPRKAITEATKAARKSGVACPATKRSVR
eukprot:364942-Chlamydomonas_euryale.AAC.5